jgi:hypothetical protein
VVSFNEHGESLSGAMYTVRYFISLVRTALVDPNTLFLDNVMRSISAASEPLASCSTSSQEGAITFEVNLD